MGRRDTLIFGSGALGHEVAMQLAERGIQVYLYSNDLDEVGGLLAKGLQAAIVNYMDDDKLREIGIGNWVKTVFCLFSDEPKNLFLTLSVRALDPNLKIVCVCESTSSGERLMAAGATKVIDPYEISGQRVHELIARPYLVEMLENTVFGKHIDIAEIEIPEHSTLSGTPLSDLQLDKRFNLITIGVVDLELGNQLIFSNSGVSHCLDAGDILVVIGPSQEITRLKRAVFDNSLEPSSNSTDPSI
ncbi:MAG: NAD-binding protein [Candidatus Thiodiazotropha sp. (ex Lucinoma annulata)]|nr:NAD-binding protein [Candidatus Thiodiazotropha sp. (ex Lucinoma borealis)]MCU7839463.1 NAD-binding protein [Candidatus Thiodiazotropha sp. (ex Troendleina suluensis)]MCU7882732.1 NAD-binding protein [Candidatus Thiodiazotropha sp. (ex Lucinoma annulata)]MCU7857528.1 NAD-binding protein [Candidatus Thiodiazotropha sp. (ex Lucinoma borealis)]MCU7863863.1 NAD-binding protein [Candidatus Thiodiazotropha sp. (ex Lucinoma borealis)]